MRPVTGRGERLSPIPARSDYVLVLVDPGFSVSTKKAYAMVDARRKEFKTCASRSEAELEAELYSMAMEYASKVPSEWSFYNDFYDSLIHEYPYLVECRTLILKEGAEFVTLSGSGSTMIGVFSSLPVAEKAVRSISSHYVARIAFPLARLHDSI